MTYRFTICGRLPTQNEIIRAARGTRGGWAASNRMKQDSDRLVAASARAAGLRHIRRPVEINYTYYEANRKRDLDNIAGGAHKFVQDGLVKAGILADDSWDYVVGFSDRFFVDRDTPRIEIEIVEV